MFLDVLFPNRCLNCEEIIPKDEIVCVKCLDKIHFTHWDFGENLLLGFWRKSSEKKGRKPVSFGGGLFSYVF